MSELDDMVQHFLLSADGEADMKFAEAGKNQLSALRARLADAERVANAAKNIMAGIEASRPGRSHELPGCPHGNIPFYPTHGWWCDGCFGELEEALAALKDGQP